MTWRKSSFYDFYKHKLLELRTPGEIFFKNQNLFGEEKVFMNVFCIPDYFIFDLFSETKKFFGKKINSFLYEVGKDFSMQYFSCYSSYLGGKRIKPNVLIGFSKNFFSLFGSVFEKIYANRSLSRSIFCGKINLEIKNKDYLFFLSGFVSGLVSFLSCGNIEAKVFLDRSGEKYKIIADKNYAKRYVRVKKEFYEVSSKKEEIKEVKKYASFFELLYFNLIKYCDKKFFFNDFSLSFFEIHFLKIFFEKYISISKEDILFNSLKNSSKKIIKIIFEGEQFEDKKISKLKNICSGFGWGIFFVSRKDDFLFVDFFGSSFVKESGFFIKIFFKEAIEQIYGGCFSFIEGKLIENYKQRFIYKEVTAGP